MEALERDNALRVARGARPRPLHTEWVNRPRLQDHEKMLWLEFIRLARFCGGDPRPADALAWFEMQGIAQDERGWMAEVFAVLASVSRERPEP